MGVLSRNEKEGRPATILKAARLTLLILPAFTFHHVGVKGVEFQALPGPEARALRAKTIRRTSFLGPGGQAVLSSRTS
jgi:hypothetical protein